MFSSLCFTPHPEGDGTFGGNHASCDRPPSEVVAEESRVFRGRGERQCGQAWLFGISSCASGTALAVLPFDRHLRQEARDSGGTGPIDGRSACRIAPPAQGATGPEPVALGTARIRLGLFRRRPPRCLSLSFTATTTTTGSNGRYAAGLVRKRSARQRQPGPPLAVMCNTDTRVLNRKRRHPGGFARDTLKASPA